jgi:hypothetical protein
MGPDAPGLGVHRLRRDVTDGCCELDVLQALTTVLVYDKRLAEAARKMRMTVASPA